MPTLCFAESSVDLGKRFDGIIAFLEKVKSPGICGVVNISALLEFRGIETKGHTLKTDEKGLFLVEAGTCGSNLVGSLYALDLRRIGDARQHRGLADTDKSRLYKAESIRVMRGGDDSKP